ncbi:MAG: paraquat-inducible protein A [Lysobacterales bacterium]
MEQTKSTQLPLSRAEINRHYVACEHCDTLWQKPDLRDGDVAHCGRCHAVLLTRKKDSTDRALASLVASLVLLLCAISFPFLSMERSGLANQISVLDAIKVLWDSGMPLMAIAAAMLTLVLPVIRNTLLIGVFSQLRRGKVLNSAWKTVFRLAQQLEPWAMVEIFMLGVVVSLVKIGKLATISVGPAFWALAVLVLVISYNANVLCRDSAWSLARGDRAP